MSHDRLTHRIHVAFVRQPRRGASVSKPRRPTPARDDTGSSGWAPNSRPLFREKRACPRIRNVRERPSEPLSIRRNLLASNPGSAGRAGTPCIAGGPSVDTRPPSRSRARTMRRSVPRIRCNNRYFTSSRTPSDSATATSGPGAPRSSSTPTSSAARSGWTWAARASRTSPAGAKTASSMPSAPTRRRSTTSRAAWRLPSPPRIAMTNSPRRALAA